MTSPHLLHWLLLLHRSIGSSTPVCACACACARATTPSARPRYCCGGCEDDVVGPLAPGSLGHQTPTWWWVLQAACSPDAASAQGLATRAIDRLMRSFSTRKKQKGEKEEGGRAATHQRSEATRVRDRQKPPPPSTARCRGVEIGAPQWSEVQGGRLLWLVPH